MNKQLKENRAKFIESYESNPFCTFDKSQSILHTQVQDDLLVKTFSYQGVEVFSLAIDSNCLSGKVYEEWHLNLNEMEHMHDIWFSQSVDEPEMACEMSY